MTQATITLTEFLLARIAEDKAVAEAAKDPARVLAECEAKRQIMADHYHRKVARGCSCELHDDLIIFWECDTCVSVTPTYQDQGGWCLSVRALASVYAGHPDYRQEWTP